MSQWQQSMAQSLTRLAGALGSGDLFAVERTQRAGSPSLWQEAITLHHGRRQRFFRVRSPADEGGAAIGQWAAAADSVQARAAAAALATAAIWELESAPVEPGQEITTWRYATDAGAGELYAPSSSDLALHLKGVDLELRRVANALTSAHAGAELTCQVSLEPGQGQSVASIWLVNEGDQDALVPNPLHPSSRDSDFLRLELGRLPRQDPGVTSSDIIYGPLAMPSPGRLPSPWDGPYVPLRAGDFLELPLSIAVPMPPRGRHFLRAVCSNYAPLHRIGDLPVLRGRVFSEEHELEVVGDRVQIKGAEAPREVATTSVNPSLLKTVVDS